jgi:hypothetical protein
MTEEEDFSVGAIGEYDGRKQCVLLGARTDVLRSGKKRSG